MKIKLFKKRNISILEEAKYNFPEDRATDKSDNKGFVNYIKKPLAPKSKLALTYAVIGLVCMAIAIRITFANLGNPDLTVSAFVFSSLVFSIAGISYSVKSFLIKKANYTLSYISIVLSGIQFLVWIMIIIVGQRG